MPTVDAQQLRAVVGAAHRIGERLVPVAVRADPQWSGPDVLDGATPIRVAVCPSPLAVRAALADYSAESGELLAMLTPCDDRDLGPDVLARVAKRRVLSLDPFTAVTALFGATVLDPTLVRDDRWLIDDLIELAPPGGWPAARPVSGVLDADLAWQTWHRERFGDVAIPGSVADVIEIGERSAVGETLRSLIEERRHRVATRWAQGVAPVELLVDLIAYGNTDDLVAFGLIADVLYAITDDPALAHQQTLARVRFEPVLGRDRLNAAAARRWADAAHQLLDTSGSPSTHLDRAEQLLADNGSADLAVLSDRLPRGFELRLAVLAGALRTEDIAAAETALADIRRHQLALRRPARVAKAEAALRLLRRSRRRGTTTPASSFAEAVTGYAADGAWVDELRLRLADGDSVPELAAVYTDLGAAIDAERREADVQFATLLADWSKSEPVHDPRLAPLEHVLTEIVAPVAADAPVLVLVCDGMSLAVANELLRDIALEGWTLATPADREAWPTGVALLPTVTEVSRTSLLAGSRIEGGQAEEQTGFTSHPALRAASNPAKPPVLFHKGRLMGPSGQALPDDVRAVLADTAQRVVGVVVNTVDDHLNRGQQIHVDWGLDTIKPVAWLLDAAAEAGRVVVLTADHGHVIHGEGAMLRPAGSDVGERWRTAPPEPQPDEVEVAGPRVLKSGRVVLPADGRIRYGGHKHGYHGGATPQEVLVPVAVLARTLPEGWVHRPLAAPAWWNAEPSLPALSPAPARPRPAPPTRAPQPTLFEPEPAPAAEPVSAGVDTWVTTLLAGPTFVAQRQRLPRPIPDERIAGYLRHIHHNGGEIPLATLATRTGEPPDQLRMTLTMLQRLLNVDGTEILAVRGDQTVELNTSLLAIQFEVAIP
jgi:hypothetical protein